LHIESVVVSTFEKNIASRVRSVLIESQYLPPISYFVKLAAFNAVVLEKHERFPKRTYRNRCYINSAQGTDRLVVPLVRGGRSTTGEVRIDYSQKWLTRHWRALQSSYGKAPYFEHYGPGLRDVLFMKYDFLLELNKALLSLCLDWLGLPIPILETRQYEKAPEGAVIDLRNTIIAKKRTELQETEFPFTYTQVFGSKFVPDLSVVDLVFCTGPEAGRLVKSAANGIEQMKTGIR
jgi:hypothetical protein